MRITYTLVIVSIVLCTCRMTQVVTHSWTDRQTTTDWLISSLL